jgi:membrane protein YqaA with SNARE-associated domain
MSQPTETAERSPVVYIAGLVTAIAITIIILLSWDQFERLGVYGYPAVFLASLFSSATLIFPAPGIAFILATGSSLDPVAVGVVAGLGAAIGELTGYLAGFSGQVVVRDRPLYRRMSVLMRKAGVPILFALALVPNPIFDVGGIMAGVLRIPAWAFILVTWAGKSIRFALLVAAVARLN